MLLRWIVLSIVAFITKTASNSLEENGCDLSLQCTNNSLSLPVIRSKQPTLKCSKITFCDRLGNSTVAVNQFNKSDIYLKGLQIKPKKNGYQLQVKLSSHDDFIKQGNHSLLVKFSFGRSTSCYQFLIPNSVFMDSKDIVLSCFKTSVLPKDHLEIFFYVHKKTGEVISIQAMNFSLNNVAVGQWLGGSLFRITSDLDEEFIYFSLNATQDLKCTFNYSISVYEHVENHPCSIKQTPVYRWSDTLNSPYQRLNMSQKLLYLSEKYCIYAIFVPFQQCGILQPHYMFYISFFKLLPGFCRTWNFSIAIKSYKIPEREGAEGVVSPVPTARKDLIATMTLWKKYPSCFSYYCMFLYKFDSSTCDTDYGHPIPVNIQARPNKTVVINSPVCRDRGYLLLLEKLNSETRPYEIEVAFKNVTIGFYCIVVVPYLVDGTPKDSWSRDSREIVVNETGVYNIELEKKDESIEFGTKVIVAISFLLFFTTFALWSCSVYIRRSKAKLNKAYTDKKETTENLPLLALSVDKVYLFHSHDDNTIRSYIAQLKILLEDGAPFSVITLSDLLPDILEQPDVTVSNILDCGCSGRESFCTSNKRFIIVISEKVLCNMMHISSRNKDLMLRSLEDRAFHMVLDSISANWREAYCHLFLVAFNESIFEDRKFQNMALKNLGAHFTIPERLESLRQKLGLSSSMHVWREELNMYPEH